MIKQFLTVAGLLAAVVTAEAQSKFKFGVHIDPTVSILGSNEKAVTRAGSNVAFRFGVQGDIYLNEGQNYAITFGTGFLIGAGGTLKYRDGGRVLPNSDLDKAAFASVAGTRPSSGENLSFTQGTTVKYSVNYVPISAGFKLVTEEFGDSYLRAFFHLPTIDILIPVSARGTIKAPNATGDYLDTSVDTATMAYIGMYGGESKKENVYSEIIPIQIAAGVGAGVEWSPNKEGGIRLIGGIYYSAAVLDMTKKVQLYDPLDPNTPQNRYVQKNPRSAFQNISLRIGVSF